MDTPFVPSNSSEQYQFIVCKPHALSNVWQPTVAFIITYRVETEIYTNKISIDFHKSFLKSVTHGIMEDFYREQHILHYASDIGLFYKKLGDLDHSFSGNFLSYVGTMFFFPILLLNS